MSVLLIVCTAWALTCVTVLPAVASPDHLRCGEHILLEERRAEIPPAGLERLPTVAKRQAASIVLEAGPGLQANPAALEAWQRAVGIWESWLEDGVTVTIQGDLQPLGSGVVGSTAPEVFLADYSYFRDAVVADADLDEALALSLPDAEQISLLLPPGFSFAGEMVATKANLRALGFDMSFDPDPDAVMNFNSNMVADFDFDPSDGIDVDKFDFEAVVVHEIGHVLGFSSELDNVDLLAFLGFPTTVPPRPLDLFRLRPGDAASDFTMSPRVLTTGLSQPEQVFFDGGRELALSTGEYTGDGFQASHWKVDEVTGTYLGIMDATIAPGDRQVLTPNDIRAFGLIGWDVASDCNANGIADAEDIASGTSLDVDGDGVPDECTTDCNNNGVADDIDISSGTSIDCNANGVPDECEAVFGDCNANGVPDECDIAAGTSEDLNDNALPDECEPFVFPAEPTILAIEDIDNDQGRQVRVLFQASNRDAAGSPTPILQYEVLRRVDPLPAAKLLGWDVVGSISAHGESGYSLVVPTLADSTVTFGMHWSVFTVRAATAEPLVFFDSPADSGYSVDDLAPTVPGAFVVSGTAEGNLLSWDPSPEPDVRYYRIYASTGGDFEAGPDALVHLTTETSWHDTVPDSGLRSYRLSAVDFAGNESATVAASSATSSDAPGRLGYTLNQNEPNPFNPRTVIRFSVPTTTDVRITIHDLAGRHVRSFHRPSLGPGEHSVTWDGRDAGGRSVASGIYLYRLDAEKWSQTRRMVLLR